MANQIVSSGYKQNYAKRKIIQLCFDSTSIHKYSPGLKMIYAMDDPPLFVKLERRKNKPSSDPTL
jgi:hypothetical protein